VTVVATSNPWPLVADPKLSPTVPMSPSSSFARQGAIAVPN
jgi:hypothetical protein